MSATKQEHMDAYRRAITQIKEVMDAALESADPVAALLDAVQITDRLSTAASEHLAAAKNLQ